MNYYERYCGDYMRDTMHLTLQEHGAFTLLLDTYYATERPLPGDLPSLYRICRAMTKLEQSAVDRVCGEFFPISQDGLRHNSRADREIAEAQPRIAAARLNGKRGGRLKRTQQEPSGLPTRNPTGNPVGNPSGSPPETQPGETLHTPHPIPQVKQKRKPAPTTLPDDFGISDRVARWAAEKGHGRLEEHLENFVSKAKSKGYTYIDWDEGFMGAIRADWAQLTKRGQERNRDPTLQEQRASNVGKLTGKGDGAIDSTAERMGDAPLLEVPGDLRQPGSDHVGRRRPG